ncbi:PKD domain-containing protein [Novosphingobium sp. G106]|uniref:PKD domain-containing protein n=1 Tax=Novosphingobium sp. G106 TaxID=2849500 RepID=UPI001C2DCCDF|nr:PKD domain-containing protein [Novosphingobium sp. G106]MBV1686708.1 PKD domain-containing protein [Novosphingobium sp. G106]
MLRRSRVLAKGLALSLAVGLAAPAVQAADPAPATATTSAPTLYSPDSDPYFAQPYVDIDEWRDAPVRHRYVHGGFKGTDTKFSFYFPPKAQYQGRFFQHITPAPDSENLAQLVPAGEFNKIGSSIAAGAYFVETNGGGKIDLAKGSLALSDPMITAYKANAAAAAYSRKVALEMYGGKRPYGYAYGGSGGAYRTIGSIENTHGVWDGVVPYVVGSTMAIPNMFTVRMQALRVLRDKFPQIIDAEEPGGSGDPYAGLTPYEASVLHEIEQMGFPMKSWFGYKTMGLHGFAALYGGVAMADPTYFSDFWTKPGYLGHDHPEYFTKDRIQFKTTVGAPITAAEAARLGLSTNPFEQKNRGGVDTAFKGTPDEANKVVGFRLNTPPPPVYFLGGELVVSSGAAKGKRLMLLNLSGDSVLLGFADPTAVAQVEAGDEVTVDNSNFLAMETYHRHQVPGPEFTVWDQFRKPDGTPIYPQRPMLLGPIFTKSTAGSLQTGVFEGKMIVAASLWDREAMPWQADWYRERVKAHLGAKTDENFRLWYSDHALHGDEPTSEAASRIVTYVPVLQQALIDLAAWVEKGVAPPASSVYRIDKGQVVPASTAAQRRGIQPVVTLRVNGSDKVEVAAGQAVSFTGTIDVPPGAGSVVAAEWDFEGTGNFAETSAVPRGAKRATVIITHRFDKPGTYFTGLRGVSQRQGDRATPYTRIRNLDRVRVIVK